MIGNRYAHGRHTILEAGEINRATLALEVAHYLVCDPAGNELAPRFASLDAARAFIDQREHLERHP
jgi:hypothetical protein